MRGLKTMSGYFRTQFGKDFDERMNQELFSDDEIENFNANMVDEPIDGEDDELRLGVE